MIICCILLFAGLVVFLLWNRQTEQEFIRQIELGAVAEADSDGFEEQQEDQNSITQEDEDIQSNGTVTGADVNNNAAIQGISFRGDSFCEQDQIADAGFGAYMTKLLQEKNQNVLVEDYTMHEAGSMSHMKLAGVAQKNLDSYLKEHQKLAEEQTLRITEIKIRELTDEELVRDDQAYVPVICAGYYGGWVSNLEELCDQLQLILDTYQQKEKYLILGIYPNVYKDEENYREVMSARWGEHFLLVEDRIIHSVSSKEGKQEAVQLVYDKFVELGYINDEQESNDE